MDDILSSLNSAQLKAVTLTEGYIRVIAGAGTGKTRALSHRFAYLVNDLGILPGNILCVTFTNKAANEMRQRIHRLTGDNDTGYICTFHSFCVSVLQDDSHAVSYPKSFLVLDNADIDSMLKIIYDERGLTLRDMTFSKARDMIEIRKLFKEPEYYLDIITMSLEDIRQKYLTAVTSSDIIFYGYLYQEKKCFGLDYNDLIKFTLYIFEKNPAIRLKWQKRLEYIMIDEFQDIDELQYKLMEVLCGYHKNLFIVGDPDQTIYTWRGANVKYLMDFDKVFSGVTTIMMLDNYRSTPQIVAVCNSLIDKNDNRIKKALIPTLSDGINAKYFHAATAEEESAWIAMNIKELHDNKTPYRDIAVLYRAHYITRNIEDSFLTEKIPYSIYSGVQFFERAEIKDALSYLRLIALRDDLSFLRVANLPKRNLGVRRMKFLQDAAASSGASLYDTLVSNLDNEIFKGTKAAGLVALVEFFSSGWDTRPISELLSDILDRSGYETMLRTEGSQARLDNLAELKQSVHEYEVSCGEESTLDSYLSHVALFTNSDISDVGDKVKLMTVHAAKGLEFPYVFLVSINEGIFPSRKTNTINAMEEERRLAFVAMTRAERGLYLSDAEGRAFDGSPRYPSRFLLDIDRHLLTVIQSPSSSLVTEAKDYIQTSCKYLLSDQDESILKPGQRVKHSVFGRGTVIDIDMDKGAHLVKFDSINTPRAISFRAKLSQDE